MEIQSITGEIIRRGKDAGSDVFDANTKQSPNLDPSANDFI
jgi:hypothetical protein